MPKTNYHCHDTYSDGRTGIPELVTGAAAMGFDALGITSHGPLPFPTEWNMAEADMEAYLGEIRSVPRLRGIEVYAGLEIDWLPGKVSAADPYWQGLGLDYSIGSVHFLEVDGELFTIDGPQEDFDSAIAKHFKGDAAGLYKLYYAEMRSMIEKGGFTILGHFDVIMKNNKGDSRFDSSSKDYLAEVSRTLDLAAEGGVIVEINTGGLARKRADQLYPHERLIPLLRERDIPVCVNSDAHSPDQLDGAFDIAHTALAQAGYTHTTMLLGGQWVSVPLEKSGVSGR